jgi:hypothetical protein
LAVAAAEQIIILLQFDLTVDLVAAEKVVVV